MMGERGWEEKAGIYTKRKISFHNLIKYIGPGEKKHVLKGTKVLEFSSEELEKVFLIYHTKFIKLSQINKQVKTIMQLYMTSKFQ
jgi:hypothetical protein